MELWSWLTGKRLHSQTIAESSQRSMTIPKMPQPLQTIEGRRLLTGASYVLPKDEEEINRLDFQHFILRTLLQSNYVAPLPGNLRDILDVGSGTGRWAKEIALEFPMANVIGCDLVEDQPDQQLMPSNYRFLPGDILKGLAFPAESFDFVHQRLLFLGIPIVEWPRVIQELVRLTRPGGWVELVETEFTMSRTGEAGQKVKAWLLATCRLRGVDPLRAPNMDDYLRNAGLKNVVMRSYKAPVGKWGGRVGTMLAANGAASLQALKPMVVAKLGVNADEFERIAAAAMQESEMLHATGTFYVAYGQRPC